MVFCGLPNWILIIKEHIGKFHLSLIVILTLEIILWWLLLVGAWLLLNFHIMLPFIQTHRLIGTSFSEGLFPILHIGSFYWKICMLLICIQVLLSVLSKLWWILWRNNFIVSMWMLVYFFWELFFLMRLIMRLKFIMYCMNRINRLIILIWRLLFSAIIDNGSFVKIFLTSMNIRIWFFFSWNFFNFMLM